MRKEKGRDLMRKSVLVYLVLLISIFCYANICFAATKGDINGDGRINESDRQILSDYLQGRKTLTDYEKSLADINGDSIVDNRDLDILTQIAKENSHKSIRVLSMPSASLERGSCRARAIC